MARHVILAALLALALFALWAPNASAGVDLRGRDYLVDSLLHAAFWVNLTLTAPHSTDARAEADTDLDGTVSEAERTAYEERLRRAANDALTDPQLYLDGQEPTRQAAVRVTSRELTGSTARTDPAQVDYQYSVDFPAPPSQEEHKIERPTAPTDKGPVQVTVPPGFVALRGRGIDHYVVSNNNRTVSGWNDGLTRVEVIFGPSSRPEPFTGAPGESPAGSDANPTPDAGKRSPGVAAAAAAIVFAWAAWGRR